MKAQNKTNGDFDMSLISPNKQTLMQEQRQFALSPIAKWVKTAVLASMASSFAFSVAAQEPTEGADDDEVEVVNVVGTRKTIQDQIAIKRC